MWIRGVNMTGYDVENICCFTGHRFENDLNQEDAIRPLLDKAIDKVIDAGYVVFISGMAVGTDVWAAEIIASKKKSNKDIKLICALPHPGFEKKRSEVEKLRYEKIINYADDVVEVSEHYFRSCYQKRNTWMVDNSSLMIAAFNGEKGGTKNTIDYARRKGKKIDNILEMGE